MIQYINRVKTKQQPTNSNKKKLFNTIPNLPCLLFILYYIQHPTYIIIFVYYLPDVCLNIFLLHRTWDVTSFNFTQLEHKQVVQLNNVPTNQRKPNGYTQNVGIYSILNALEHFFMYRHFYTFCYNILHVRIHLILLQYFLIFCCVFCLYIWRKKKCRYKEIKGRRKNKFQLKEK